jgi:hypothetical protein
LVGQLDDQLDILTGGYDDELYLRHDLSKVWVLGRHRREEADRAAADLERGAINFDEYREATGRKALKVPATRVLWLPTNGRMAVAKDDETMTTAVQAPFAMAGGGMLAPEEIPPPEEGGEPEQLPAAANKPTMRLLPAGRRNSGGPDSGLDREAREDLEGKQGPPRTNGSPGAAAWC